MSIDNGVYIIKYKNSYKVCEAQSIENLWWWNTDNKDTTKWEKRDEMNPEQVEKYFGKTEPYNSKEEALNRAMELYKETLEMFGMCEYGIQDLGEV